MQTFTDLYEFLQSYDGDDIIEWLNHRWDGKDKQESLLRLFAGLGLIDKLKAYDICKGNFNMKTITKHTSIKDIFYDGSTLINLKDKSDASDLTGICKENDKHLLLTTSKNLNKTLVGKLDIDKILTNFEQYDGYTMSLCICIRDCDDFRDMKNRIEKSNKILLSFLEKKDTIIIDWNDLNQAYHQFKMNFGNKSLDKIINSNKTTLCLKMHQLLGVRKSLRLKNDGIMKILWGHIQRSGKSYIIGGTIIEHSKNKNMCNYLIITTAPNETIEQQRKVFDCIQLNDFNIVVLNGKNKKPELANKNIILCSKQFLQKKIDNGEETTVSIRWLKKIQFDIRFIDESHNGGTTELAKKTLNYYGKNAFTVQITATYSKPANDFNIPKENWVLWDLEDIKLCKDIEKKKNINRLVEKHGDDIKLLISKYSLDNIIQEYSKYPELWCLTHEIKQDVLPEIIAATKDNSYGWSPEACFLLKQLTLESDKNQYGFTSQFQNEEETLKLWYTIFGKTNTFGIPDKEFPDNIVFMKRIQQICQRAGSRFIGEGDFHNEPMIIMAFLPVYTDKGKGYLSKLSKATIKLLKKHKVCKDYDIISINDDGKGKKDIENARNKARNSGKKGVLVLSGTKCGLGVSIENCDIVLLLNNSKGFDMIYQMMFRSMTEGKNKKCGFVVDLDIQRAIETSVNYASIVKPERHPSDAIKFILQERLINLNGDHWMLDFGNNNSMIDSLCDNMYEIYTSDVKKALNNLLNRLNFKELLLTHEEQSLFNDMFTTRSRKKNSSSRDVVPEDTTETIQKGIEKTELSMEEKSETSSESHTSSEPEEIIQEKVSPGYILRHISPLMCFLSIRDKGTSFIEMANFIQNNEEIYSIFIEQIISWWGDSIDINKLKDFFNIYIKHMKDDKKTEQLIRSMKEIILKNALNLQEISRLIDEYLIPQELEVKNNAEVSTPYDLRQKMLNTIPSEFWKSPKKVFEPCVGKGGFCVDIIDKFMNGLKDLIPDEDERRRVIIEECLYFSDINSTNLFICKNIIFDPSNKGYKLNYNEGDTLKLDITKTTEHWNGCTGFDAIIGNPPYQIKVGKKKTHAIWPAFTIKSIDELNEDGYLLFVHPSGWRSPTGSFRNVYEKISSKNLIYLNMNNFKEGQKVFGVGTNFDYYLVQNNDKKQSVEIIDMNEQKCNVDLSKWSFIPSGGFKLYNKLLAKDDEEKVNIIHDWTMYETRKPHTSRTKKGDFIYPCMYSITIKDGMNCIYSSKNLGHFGVAKVIWSNGGGTYPIVDKEGEYGLTQFSYAITDDKENLDNIAKAMNNKEFIELMKYVKYQAHKYNYKVIGLFKKDFWKEFI